MHSGVCLSVICLSVLTTFAPGECEGNAFGCLSVICLSVLTTLAPGEECEGNAFGCLSVCNLSVCTNYLRSRRGVRG